MVIVARTKAGGVSGTAFAEVREGAGRRRMKEKRKRTNKQKDTCTLILAIPKKEGRRKENPPLATNGLTRCSRLPEARTGGRQRRECMIGNACRRS